MKSNSIDIVGIRLVRERRILSKHSIESPFDAVEVLANELKYLDREMMMMIWKWNNTATCRNRKRVQEYGKNR